MSDTGGSPNDLLNLRSFGLRLVFVLIFVTQLLLALEGIGGVRSPLPVFAALVSFGIGLAVLAASHPEPLSLKWVLVVLVASVATNALIVWNLPEAGWPAYADWNFGAVAWLCFFLAFRGRILAAVLGWVLMATLAQVWGASIGETPLQALGHVDRHAGTIAIAVLFRVLFVRTSRRIVALREVRLTQVAAEAASLAEIRERESQGIRLNDGARPALQQIAEGDYLDAARQQRYTVLEASLRDGLRGGRLASPTVAEAAERARIRGVEVVLLDDRNAPLSESDATRVAVTLLDELVTAQDGRVTGRLLPDGREVYASVVSVASSRRHRIDLRDASGVRSLTELAVEGHSESSPPVRVPPELF